MEEAREFQKNIYLSFIDCAKAFDCGGHNKLWKILTEMGIPDHLTCLLRNLYAGQEATVSTGDGTTDWFQIGKRVRQGCILLYTRSNTLTTWCKKPTHWISPWCWERLKVGGKEGGRGWNGWVASPTRWTWVCLSSRSWWWTGKPGMLRFMGSQRVRHDWATKLNWTEIHYRKIATKWVSGKACFTLIF